MSAVATKPDLVVGVAAITKAFNDEFGCDLSERQVRHLCETGALPGVFRLGIKFAARRSTMKSSIDQRERAGLEAAGYGQPTTA